MEIERLGDRSLILRDLNQLTGSELLRLVERLQVKGIIELAPAPASLGVTIDPNLFDLVEFSADLKAASDRFRPEQTSAVGKFHDIPVCYERGLDWEDVVCQAKHGRDELIKIHSGTTYTCAAVGFSPGFPYLTPLPAPLDEVRRRPSPRTRVEPGMVGIAGGQTGIYPSTSPGGWQLIARTPLQIVSLADGYFPIAAGDQVRFHPIAEAEYEARVGERL